MNSSKKAPISKSTIFFYVSAAVVLIIGIVSLTTQVNSFNSVVAQYVAQGYEKSEVMAQLLPSQLLPSIYSILSLNLGLSAILLGLGFLSQKLAVLMPQAEVIEAVVEHDETIDAEMDSEVAEEVSETVETVEALETETEKSL